MEMDKLGWDWKCGNFFNFVHWVRALDWNQNFVLSNIWINKFMGFHQIFIWASLWENVSSGISDQVRLQLACSATEASMTLAILVTETRDITLSRQQTTKALIRLHGCAGWSVPLLFAYDIRHIFSWPSSYALILTRSRFRLYMS